MGEVFGRLLAAEFLQWVGPEQVAHWTKRRRLLESVQLTMQPPHLPLRHLTKAQCKVRLSSRTNHTETQQEIHNEH